jgi:hypothetical protein
MTNNCTLDETLADIFGPLPTERERILIERVALLQNYVFELQEANERLGQQSRELLNKIAVLKKDALINPVPRDRCRNT